MVTPAVAPVRPRIVSPTCGDALLLEDFVFTAATKTAHGAIHIDGPIGAGKTTALCHLAATVRRHLPIVLLDDANPHEVLLRCASELVVYTCTQPVAQCIRRGLAPWGEDDLIEYLLARHDRQAGRVFNLLRGAADRSLAGGSPELCRIVIDRLAGDESLRTVGSALLAAVEVACDEFADRDLAARFCEGVWQQQGALVEPPGQDVVIPRQSRLWRLLRFPAVRMLVTADRIAARLRIQQQTLFLTRHLPRELVNETAVRVKSSPLALQYLRGLAQHAHAAAPMASSILHATGAQWRPQRPNANLECAYLDGADWKGIALQRADLRLARLASSDLRGAVLKDLDAERVDLSGSRLDGATIERGRFLQADFSGASLRGVTATKAHFSRGNFKAANLRQATLTNCHFERADLRDACCYAADLSGSRLIDADVTAADFRCVNFTAATLSRLQLRMAELAGAIFKLAHLRDCDLECIEWDDAIFERADVCGAYLTGSVLRRANFYAADLRGAGLGEIVWDGADLRHADLTGCSFQMGSTRSGMVDSPYPSEGTRTGFYTDDFDDRFFKRPEEIRKASLRGARLNGAKIDGVDFYLVDLREAIYDDSQKSHFAATGAILS